MYRSLLLVPLLVAGLAGPASADPLDELRDLLQPHSLTLPHLCVDGSPEDQLVEIDIANGTVDVDPDAGPYVYTSEDDCGSRH